MTDILIEGGDYQFDADRPFEIKFSAASDLIMPFVGTLILPEDNDTEPDFSSMGMHHWVFTSFRFPHKAAADSAGRRFPVLRTRDNKPLKINGECLFLVENDIHHLADTPIRRYFGDVPKIVVIQIDGERHLPRDFPPVTRDKGFKLAGNTDSGAALTALREVLEEAPISGTIMAFDHAGLQIPAYPALLKLKVDKTPSGSPLPETDGTQINLLFVDLHGNPLRVDEFPLDKLEFAPPLVDSGHFYTLQFTDAERIIKVNRKDIPADTDDNEKYTYKSIFAAYWPGHDFDLQAIGAKAEPSEFNLKEDFSAAEENQPTFIRLCVFHPQQEFQTKAGGEIEVKSELLEKEQLVFKDNKFHLFSDRNEIEIFLTGQAFFKDLYNELNTMQAGEQFYLANWITNAHLHLNGSMQARNVEVNDLASQAVNDILQTIRRDGLIFTLETESTEVDAVDYLLIANHEEKKDLVTASFAVQVFTSPLPEADSKVTHQGFVRRSSIYALKLFGDPNLTQHLVKAYWKNSMGIVLETTLDDIETSPLQTVSQSIEETAFSLEIDSADPPKAILIRKLARDAVSTLDPTVFNTIDAHLLVFNLASGESQFVALVPAGDNGSGTDLPLGTLDTLTAEDTLAVAIVDRKPVSEQDFSTTILTNFREIKFSDEAHLLGRIPLQEEELGGVIRKAIASGAKCKALFWEQFLAKLDKNTSFRRGHKTNEELAEIINRTVDSKRGFAILDRATRPLGAFHQKATVFVKDTEFTGTGKKVIAYLGGMDSSKGKWDTAESFTDDPDRQGGRWFDFMVKISGEAALDVLLNFKQRWISIPKFVDDLANCRPKNLSEEIEDELEKPFSIPKDDGLELNDEEAFIQINRTIPPFSCYANLGIGTASEVFVEAGGELGCLESYKKAIASARKFIIINDQYFFNQEITLLLHNALKSENGPEFVIVVLPQNLQESELVDPLFYKIRERAINTLYYGGTDSSSEGQSKCGKITANTAAPDAPSVKDKVALLTPVNRTGEDIYVHAKHIIVDDALMSIGSANFSNRGLTYEVEINASIIGRKLFKGGTNVVRHHRVELCSKLLGLPRAYDAVLQDPFAVFQLLKAIEQKKDDPGFSLHPLKPMVKWLNAKKIPKIGKAAYDQSVDFVATMQINDKALDFWTCNLNDIDGRSRTSDRAGYLAALIGVGKNPAKAFARITFNYDTDCETTIKGQIDGGGTAKLRVFMTFKNGEDIGPFETDSFILKIDPETDNIVLTGLVSGELSLAISTQDKVLIKADIVDDSDIPLNCEGEVLIDPLTQDPPLLSGSEIEVTINLSTTI